MVEVNRNVTVDGNPCVFINNIKVAEFSKYEDFAYTCASNLVRSIKNVLSNHFPEQNKKNKFTAEIQ